MSPKVVTWYANGEERPWRVTIDRDPLDCPRCGGNDMTGAHERWCDNEDELDDETRRDTFHELMLYLGDAWTKLMPEPVDPRTRRT